MLKGNGGAIGGIAGVILLTGAGYKERAQGYIREISDLVIDFKVLRFGKHGKYFI